MKRSRTKMRANRQGAAMIDKDQDQVRPSWLARAGVDVAFVAGTAGAGEAEDVQGWDPYEVWLRRIHQPRLADVRVPLAVNCCDWGMGV
jgi:hypothetical protein